jgi:diphosphomevalonate decarboxylase
MTSNPRLLYWQPATMAVMRAVTEWRAAGLSACYTIDAGPNVHIICPADYLSQVKAKLEALPGIKSVLTARPGGSAYCLTND